MTQTYRESEPGVETSPDSELIGFDPSPASVGGRGSRGRRVGMALAKLLLVIWGSTLLTFLVLNAMPGDPVAALLGVNATPEATQQLREQLNLDDPLWHRYLAWLGAAVTGDLGTSLASNQAVGGLILERVVPTLELFLFALVLSVVLAYVVALMCAISPHGPVDKVLSWITTATLAVPDFVAAILLVFLLAVTWQLLPSLGYVPFTESPGDNLRSMILPALGLALPRFAIHARVLRTELVSRVATSDYVLAARAKGASHLQIMYRHGLKNASFTLIPIIGANIPKLLGGTVVIESVFAIPGMGSLLVQAVQSRDAPTVQGVVLVFAVVTVMAAVAAERLWTWLDPRVGGATA